MTSPHLPCLLLTIFLFAKIGGCKCENTSNADFFLQKMKPDPEGDSDYLQQIERVLSTILGKIEKINKRLTMSEDIIKNQTDGIASLRLEMLTLIGMKTSFAQKESPFVLDVSSLPFGRGAIEFDQKETHTRKRRFWTLERAGEMRFTLENNELKEDSRLTISGFKTTETFNSTDHWDEVYINSTTANGTEFTVSGVVVLITLTSDKKDIIGLASSFILRFLHIRNDKVLIPGRVLYPSTFVTAKGPAVASFPVNNAAN